MHAKTAEISRINDIHRAVVIRVARIPHIEFSDVAIGISVPEGILPCSLADLQADHTESLRRWLSGCHQHLDGQRDKRLRQSIHINRSDLVQAGAIDLSI
jgi:hypothetical protein